jgi:hypothetical protein
VRSRCGSGAADRHDRRSAEPQDSGREHELECMDRPETSPPLSNMKFKFINGGCSFS